MASIFTKIISGEIPCFKVAEDENHLAFFDIQPLGPGHTLVVPKKETDYIFDIEDQEHQALWTFAKDVSKAIKANVDCNRIGVAVIGLEVPHAHIHLVPIDSLGDIDFTRPRANISKEKMQELADRILATYSSL